MDIRAGTSSLTMSHQAPLSGYNSAEVKGSENIPSPSCFTGRDVKQQATVSVQYQMSPPVASGQPSGISAQRISCPHHLLLSPKELADEIRLETNKELQACKTLPVFYVGVACKAARFTKSAEQRMYDDGLSIDDVKHAFHLSPGKYELNDIHEEDFDRFYFVANHRVIVHLMKYSYDESFSPHAFKPGIDVFEYFTEWKHQWLPARAEKSFEYYPEPLVDPRYIQINAIPTQCSNELETRVTTNNEKYLVDKVTECFTGTLGVIHHTLLSPMPDNVKVAFLSDLINLETTVPSPEGDSVESGGTMQKCFSATEYLTRIRYAPGGYEYQALCDKNPHYKEGTI